jgi:hypothetical protein
LPHGLGGSKRGGNGREWTVGLGWGQGWGSGRVRLRQDIRDGYSGHDEPARGMVR